MSGTATFAETNSTTQDPVTWAAQQDANTIVAAGIVDAFAVHAQATPNMTVVVEAGLIPQAGTAPLAVLAQSTAAMTAPVTNPRNDLVYIDRASGAAGIATGAEASTPADPALPAGKIVLSRIRHAVGETAIQNSQIDDLRAVPATSAPGNSAGDLRAAGADFAADSSTAANTVTVALTPAPAALYAGFAFAARIANTNTGPTAVNVNGLGPVNVMKGGTTPLSGGELPAGWIAAFRHDGTNLQLLNPVPATVAFIAPSIVTASGTVTIPANAKSAKVIVTGAGGGGGNSVSADSGSGGGAGGTAIKWLTGLTPGNTFVATIGAAGTPSINGGASSLASGTQTIATITGSGGASGAAGTPGGPGGAASAGDVNTTGGDGGPGVNASVAAGGTGGASYWGGGGSGGTQASGGASAKAPGAGGGGGGISGSTYPGGDGTPGVILIEWSPI